jgi:hypothetical protein
MHNQQPAWTAVPYLVVAELAVEGEVGEEARGDVSGVVENQVDVDVLGAVDDGLPEAIE